MQPRAHWVWDNCSGFRTFWEIAGADLHAIIIGLNQNNILKCNAEIQFQKYLSPCYKVKYRYTNMSTHLEKVHVQYTQWMKYRKCNVGLSSWSFCFGGLNYKCSYKSSSGSTCTCKLTKDEEKWKGNVIKCQYMMVKI